MAETPTGAQFLGIAEVAARTGLSQDTLRWYEREGVLPPVTRTSDGRRSYDEAALGMIELIVRLRRTGMPVAEIRQFRKLVDEGAASHGRRMALLQQHRERLAAHIAQLQEDMRAVEQKIGHYAGLIEAGLDCGNQPVNADTRQEQRKTT